MTAQTPLARLALASLALLPFLPACQSGSSSEGSAAAKSVTEASASIDKGLVELDGALKALGSMPAAPQAMLEEKYKTYTDHLGRLEKIAEDVKATTQALQQQRTTYFATWDQQLASMTNEDIRKRSEKRRAEVEKELERIREEHAEASESCQPLLSDMRDLRTALKTDLTPDGVKALKKSIDRVLDKGQDAQKRLTKLSKSFADVGAKMGAAQPVAPAPG